MVTCDSIIKNMSVTNLRKLQEETMSLPYTIKQFIHATLSIHNSLVTAHARMAGSNVL